MNINDMDHPIALLEAYSDEQLSEHISGARRLLSNQQQIRRLVPITPTGVSKRYRNSDELEDATLAIDLARKIGVRTPEILRIVPVQDGFECIFNRVQGPDLMNCWHRLGWFATIRLGLQLRQMIRRMRAQESPTAGSLGTGIARTFFLEDTYGIPLRTSPYVIMSLVNFWYNLGSFQQEKRKSSEEHRASCEGPLNTHQKLVFTHHDLAPRNLMLDQAGDLIIVDWDESGYYPPFFEHAGMYNFIQPENWGWMTVLRWKVFTWLATGFYSKEKAMLFECRRKAIRFRAARRFNVKAGATPSTRPVED